MQNFTQFAALTITIAVGIFLLVGNSVAQTIAPLTTNRTEVTSSSTISGVLTLGVKDESGLSFSGYRQSRHRNILADSCTTNSGVTGTCLTRFKCMRQGGTVNGYCGTYGVCCETNIQCGSTTRLKRTTIRSPLTFTSDSCSYTIERFNSNVQQLRIDFEEFVLSQPTASDDDETVLICENYLDVGKHKLCGVNTGQHLYLPFDLGPEMDHITLEFIMPTQYRQTAWRLVVTQLEGPAPIRRSSPFSGFSATTNSLQDLRNLFASHHADYDLLAPAGCDQYYTSMTGVIKSFNYQPLLSPNSPYLPGLSYTICIKPMSNSQIIEYSFTKFAMAANDAEAEAYDEHCRATVQTVGRQEDYLMIPQSILANNELYQPTYYCGTNDNLVVYASLPFIMHFSSDKITYDGEQEIGFSLTYRLKTTIM